MNPFTDLPWLEVVILFPLCGCLVATRISSPLPAARWTLGVMGLTTVVALWIWWAQITGRAPQSVLPSLEDDTPLLGVDALSAPILFLVALLHFLVILTTARIKMARFSFAGLLLGASSRLTLFVVTSPSLLVLMFGINVLPALWEMRQRCQNLSLFATHMGLFILFLTAGWLCGRGWLPGGQTATATLLFAAVMIRCGVVPFHLWVPELFARLSFGTALLFVTPLMGVYVAVRLVLPMSPTWVLSGFGLASIATALYAAGMATVQPDARRFFAYLFLSHASQVLLGLELRSPLGLIGALALWGSILIALGGLGLTLRALEARLGRLDLHKFHGLYEHSPTLAVCFLLTGLASVGFPGTLGFVAAEMLIDGVVSSAPLLGWLLVLAAALNGIAILRVYFLLFTGTRHLSPIPLAITRRERFAVLLLMALVLGGGAFPQTTLTLSRQAALPLVRTGHE